MTSFSGQNTSHIKGHLGWLCVCESMCVCAWVCVSSLAVLCHNMLINNMTASTSCLACILLLCSLKDCTILFPSLLLFPPVLPQCSLASPGSVCLNCWQRARHESHNAFILSYLIGSKHDFPLRINMSKVKKSYGCNVKAFRHLCNVMRRTLFRAYSVFEGKACVALASCEGEVFILCDECHGGVLINSLPWCSSALLNGENEKWKALYWILPIQTLMKSL